ncbi:hypothetical protein [Rhizobium sp. Root149]|uniref:hypothetical protein n=1 Tax=Rhizobium sp. Root149 TaxID=1736473 RepID=UPI0012E3ABB2|nr:hypothetical protein [Rhizobium sp. Root149]
MIGLSMVILIPQAAKKGQSSENKYAVVGAMFLLGIVLMVIATVLHQIGGD